MSKITNDDLTHMGLYSCSHMATVGVKGLGVVLTWSPCVTIHDVNFPRPLSIILNLREPLGPMSVIFITPLHAKLCLA